MATADPRKRGFNYGAPIAEPLYDAFYQFAKLAAEILRKRNSAAAREVSWDLDMLIRAVRVACSGEEQEKALGHLKRYNFARKLRPVQHALLYASANEKAWRFVNNLK